MKLKFNDASGTASGLNLSLKFKFTGNCVFNSLALLIHFELQLNFKLKLPLEVKVTVLVTASASDTASASGTCQ